MALIWEAGGFSMSLVMLLLRRTLGGLPMVACLSIAVVAQRGVEHRCRVAGGGEPVVACVIDHERVSD